MAFGHDRRGDRFFVPDPDLVPCGADASSCSSTSSAISGSAASAASASPPSRSASGTELVGWTDRHGTRWKISAIPLGGYVKFVGDLNAASVPDQDQLAADAAGASGRSVFPIRASPSAPPSWRRGRSPISSSPSRSSPGFNYFNGRQVLEPRIEAVQPGSAAEKAGFQPKDLILTIDGRRIETFADMQLHRELERRRAPDVQGRARRADRCPDGDSELHGADHALRQAAHRPSRVSRRPGTRRRSSA